MSGGEFGARVEIRQVWRRDSDHVEWLIATTLPRGKDLEYVDSLVDEKGAIAVEATVVKLESLHPMR